MIPTLLKYQDEAIDSLLSIINKKYLLREAESICVLHSPTGSGKTIMMAEFLKRFVDRKDSKTFSFIWAAPRKLHLQSKEKLEWYFKETRELECCNIEDLTENKIEENSILFLNWESINKSDNVFVNENERNFNLSSVIENTTEEGREIILIIDESHHTSKAENTKGLIQIMKPKITIEVSATPTEFNTDYTEKVEFKDVVKSGMIKKEVSVNPKLDEEKLEGTGSDEFILKAALEQRQALKKEFEKIGSNVNPLLIIQLPDKNKFDTEDTRKEKRIEDLLAKKFNITRENFKLAIYLSEDKENLENISKNDDTAEVLLFKQAIALGWDCPRAYILVLFREWHSETFKIQTVGRIMRMPELKHYKSEALDKAYLYTNIANTKLNIDKDIARDYYTIYPSKRIKQYENIDLVSYHIMRDRGETRLDRTFFEIFANECKHYELKKKLNKKYADVIDKIPVDATMHIENFATLNDPIEVLNNISLAKSTLELENATKLMIHNTMLAGEFYYPENRSVERIFKSIYNFFFEELNMDYGKVEKEIISIVLHEDNLQHFKNVMNLSLKEYALKHPTKSNKAVENDELWNIPELIELNANHEKRKPQPKKCVLSPFYVPTSESKNWETENKFIDFLDSNKNVEWWFKNGERDGTYFAVPYKNDENEDMAFYVDFIVKMNDGSIGLFDTKKGWTAKEAGTRSDGLQKYIAEQNSDGKNLFGSIVIPEGDSFWTYTKIPYKWDKSLKGWKTIEL